MGFKKCLPSCYSGRSYGNSQHNAKNEKGRAGPVWRAEAVPHLWSCGKHKPGERNTNKENPLEDFSLFNRFLIRHASSYFPLSYSTTSNLFLLKTTPALSFSLCEFLAPTASPQTPVGWRSTSPVCIEPRLLQASPEVTRFFISKQPSVTDSYQPSSWSF